MKKLRNFVFLMVFMVASIFLVQGLCYDQTKPKANAETLSTAVHDYVSFSQNGQPLNYSNFNNFDNSTYIITNDSLTMTFNAFDYNYMVTASDIDNFIVTYAEPIHIDYYKATNTFADSFIYKNTLYYYDLNTGNNILQIYKNAPSIQNIIPHLSTQHTNLISYNFTATERTIYIVSSYTLKSKAPNSTLNVRINYLNNITGVTYSDFFINLTRPVIDFKNTSTPFVTFNSYSNGSNTPYTDTMLQKDLEFDKLDIDIMNNTYTEYNPLYLKLNYNGFIYDYKVYSKEYGSVNYLFVNYIDNFNPSNNKYLATALISAGNGSQMIDSSQNFPAYLDSNINKFSFIFSETGRYSIEIFDSTYVAGLKNSNYYQTSFYIKNQNDVIDDFDNIYLISETIGQNNEHLDYIVSGSTLNNNVKVTFKNLAFESGKTLGDIIDRIEVVKTTFGGSNNIPTPTTYNIEQITTLLDGKSEFELNFEEDAFYQIYIYKANSNDQTRIEYEFTVVKQAKTTYTIDNKTFESESTNGDSLRITKTSTGDTYEAIVPYRTIIQRYETRIPSTITIGYKIVNNGTTQISRSQTLNKTFINNFSISYGMPQASIDTSNSTGSSVVAQFYGVGDLSVRVTFGDTTIIYKLNSENGDNTLTFTEYGTYQFVVVDSMGNTDSGSYKLSKSLTTSAIVLIALSCVLVLFITIFILKARGKVATK